MVVTLRPAQSATGVTHGLKASPSTWLVHALQTPTPQPYLGPVMPSLSRRTHNMGRSAGASMVTGLPLTVNVKAGTAGSSAGGRFEVDVVDDREAAGLATGRPRVRIRHSARGRGHAELAGATRLLAVRRHDDELHVDRRVAL